MAAGNEMRVSDAERDAAAAELREHFASGRLDQEELDQRLTAVFSARTRGDVDALFTDLPGHASSSAPFSPAGVGGAFGPSGPFGARAWGGPGTTDSGYGHGDRGDAWRGGGRGPGRVLSRFIVSAVLLWALLIVGILGVFGIGAGRPLGIVLIFAAFALLRRLLFSIFGRRRGGRGGRRGRRWS